MFRMSKERRAWVEYQKDVAPSHNPIGLLVIVLFTCYGLVWYWGLVK